jgi:hypothetical protein
MLEQTLEATRAARRDHVGASGDLEVVTGQGLLVVTWTRAAKRPPGARI